MPARNPADKLTRFTWLLTAVTVFAYTLVSFFYWNLIDSLTPFLAPFLRLPLQLLAFAALATCIILPIRRWQKSGKTTILPLFVLVTCFAAGYWIDFTRLWLAMNFHSNLAARGEVVRRLTKGELIPNVVHNNSLVALPSELASTSLGGGEVVLERDGDKLKVLFFTFRGILDHFAGYVYSSDGSTPKNGDFSGEFHEIRKVEEQWYYVSAH